MQTNLEKVIDDIKKRPADQPLSLPELHQLKEIPYAALIKEPALIKLLVRYSKEKQENGIVIYGLKIFKNLSKINDNMESTKLDSGIKILIKLFHDRKYYKITNLCIIALGNLCKQNVLLKKIDEENTANLQADLQADAGEEKGCIFEKMVNRHLEKADGKTQTAILQTFNFLTNLQNESIDDSLKDKFKEKMKDLLFEKRLLSKIVTCFVSLDKQVAKESIGILISNLLNDFENLNNIAEAPTNLAYTLITVSIIQTAEEHFIVKQLWNSFGIFSADKSPDANNDHLLNLIIKCFRKLLVLRSIRSEMLDPKFISAFSTLMNTSRSPELSFNAAICLSHYSEDIRAHDQLNKLDVLKIFCRTLKESKQKKMHNQACRFLSNISWNPKYSHTLLNNNIVVNMLSLLENQNNFKLIKYCIFAIGNLSATPNFFSKCQNMSINPIINLLDYNSEDKETIMEYASFALANISLDQSTHAEILKEPEISIIHKNFVMGDNHKIIKNLMILETPNII